MAWSLSKQKVLASPGQFARREDGGMLFLSIVFFLLMVMVGGMAVDLMRQENARTRLHQTLDRAVLAAASLKQTRLPEVVVEDYMTKAGMFDQLVDVNGTPGNSQRIVTAEGRVEISTLFMHMLDINKLRAPALSTAEESVSNIEISLVLDISGSMREGDQIGKLRAAAKSFFAKVLEGDAARTTSINVVPYAGQVNVGPKLFSRFGGVRNHTNSSCFELNASDFTSAAAPGSGRAQVPHFMQWTISTATMDWGWCPADRSAIIIAQNDIGKLNTFIDTVRLHDGTGTQNGVKYGLMLLNPALQPTFQWLSTDSTIPTVFADRPRAWSASVGSDVTKYMIVMTDGQITEQFRPKFAAFVDPDTDTIDNEQYQDGTKTQMVNGKNVTVPNMVNDPDTVDGIDYPGWNGTNTTIRKALLDQPSVNRTTDAASGYTNISTNVSRFNAQCSLAKQNGVIVYSIAFNAPAAAITQMKDCSSGPAYFYSVSNTDASEIKNAFDTIARNIKQLRLTQ